MVAERYQFNQNKMMLNPTEVRSYLEGVKFPVDKKGLIQHAKEMGASGSVITALKELPDRKFESPSDIGDDLSDIL